MFYMPYKILTLKRGKSLTDSSLVKLFKGSMSGIEIISSLCRLEIPWHASVCLLCVNVGVHVCVCDLTMSCQYIFKADMNRLHFKPTKWQSWHVPPHSHRHTRIPVSSELSQCPHYGRHYHSFGLQTLHKGSWFISHTSSLPIFQNIPVHINGVKNINTSTTMSSIDLRRL